LSELAISGGNTCARSTTRPVSGGTSRAQEAKAQVKATMKKNPVPQTLWLNLNLPPRI
jgi:hypothetical protein